MIIQDWLGHDLYLMNLNSLPLSIFNFPIWELTCSGSAWLGFITFDEISPWSMKLYRLYLSFYNLSQSQVFIFICDCL